MIRVTLKLLTLELDTRDNQGKTPLISASECGHQEVIEALVEGRANLNIQDDKRFNALGRAVLSGQLKTVNYLIKKGAQMDGYPSGDVVLIWEYKEGTIEVVNILVQVSSLYHMSYE